MEQKIKYLAEANYQITFKLKRERAQTIYKVDEDNFR